NLTRLKDTGVSFTNAFICTSMCSPSRTAMFTGRYPSQTGVTKTLGVGERYEPNKYDPTDIELNPEIPNLATMLHKSGEYGKIGYLGKWHMSKGFNDIQELLPRQIAAYGFSGWVPPDGGQDWRITNIAGGYFDKDNAYAREAISFIQERAKDPDGKPWCLVLSFINPHDIWTHPKNFHETGYSQEMLKGDIGLPKTINEDLLENRKPLAQPELKQVQDNFVGPLDTPEKQLEYVNFYGNLLKLVDGQIGAVLDALDGSIFNDSTLIVRTADHGEMGLAHGGLRQKMFNVYEETIHIPLVVSSPSLPNPGRTDDHLVSTIDLMPTIAGLLQVDPPKGLQGKDFSALVFDQPLAPENERTEVLFTFDDFRVEANRPSAVAAADRIRCVRTNGWKYARYFQADSSYKEEYEMYDLDNDPDELDNLIYTNNEQIVVQKRAELAALLERLEQTELPRSIEHVAAESK
ncbi:MAG TPA: sulfatase-like hydrolase/transferase, partial [Bacillota bacterium]|nr:sulfatase-like hydrolase/transferase [Bacillota bacterium]